MRRLPLVLVITLVSTACGNKTRDAECERVDAVARANAADSDAKKAASVAAGERGAARMRIVAAGLRRQDQELAALGLTDRGLMENLAPVREGMLGLAAAAEQAAASAEAGDLEAMGAAEAAYKEWSAKLQPRRDTLDRYCFGP